MTTSPIRSNTSAGSIGSAIPSFDIVDPSGRRRRVHPHSDADTITDLAVALGCPVGHGIRVDGRGVAAGRALTSIPDLVDGCHIEHHQASSPADGTPLRSAAEAAPDIDVGLEFAIVAGPSCRAWAPLPAGRHGLGRSPHATIRLGDPLAEIHHATLDVAADDTITLTQLTGRVPIRVVRPVAGGPGDVVTEPAGAFERVVAGDALLVGSSRIEVRHRTERTLDDTPRRGTIAPIPGDPWRREVRRAPHERPDPPDPPVLLPPVEPRLEMPAATALVGAVLAVIGAVVIAGLLHQMMFAVFAAVGAVASGATWAVGALSVWRRRRAGRRSARLGREEFAARVRERHLATRERHRRRYLEVADVLDMLTGDRSSVWHQRPFDTGRSAGRDGVVDRGFEVVIGRGSCRVDPVTVDAATGAAPDHAAAFAADVAAAIEDACVLRDVPVPIRLVAGEVTAIRGETLRVRSVIRSLLVQIGASVGPADVRIVVIGNPEHWQWVGWLPHVRTQTRGTLFAPRDVDRLAELPVTAEFDGRAGDRGPVGAPATVLVIDDPALLAVRTGPLRRFMSESDAITIVAVDAAATVPAVCRRTLDVASTGGADWSGDAPERHALSSVLVAGLDEPTACRAARAMTPLVDPEMPNATGGRIPDETTLASLDPAATPAGAEAIARRWTEAGRDPSLRAPIGVSSDGVVEVDLVADGPHALVAGTTGSGKSELLRTLVVSMASRVSPVHLNFVLIDYKGGSTFDSCAALPHTVGLVTDLDDGLAHRALVSLEAELARRERMLRQQRVGDLTEYRRCPGAEPIPRLVVVIDEFATLAHDLPDFLRALVAIAQRGRSLGVHVVLATQRPAGVVTDDIRANTDLRLALRVNDVSEARDVVDDVRPALFAKSLPGRAMLRLATDEPIVFQAARCTGAMPSTTGRLWVESPTSVSDGPQPEGRPEASPTELGTAVRAICEAAAGLFLPPPRRPWIVPLPDRLDHGTVDDLVRAHDGGRATTDETPSTSASEDSDCHDAIGIVDDPANQRRLPLRWNPAAGNLAIFGSLGSGRTSTVVALVAALCRTASPAARHVYVIDGTGDRSLDGLITVAHCGAVVRAGEAERTDRLLRRLSEEIDRRSTLVDAGSRLVQIVLFVDGLGELRRSLDAIERLDSLSMLDRILDAGPAVGVTSCITLDAGGATVSVPAAERWILRLDDPDLARAAGLKTAVRAGVPPGRLWVVSSGLEAQVAVGADGLACLPSRPHPDGPADLVVLPAEVEPSGLPRSHTSTDSGRSVRHLVVGLESGGLVPAALRVPDGDHILVGGAARTGVSTALGRVVAAWIDCSPDASAQHSVVRWRSSTGELRERLVAAVGTATLLVVDDAERAHDRDGLFAEILRGDHPHVTIVAGARLEAVRSAYGHWTREVARSRCGIVMTAPGEIDGELLGAVLPRRSVVGPRPGLGWVIDGGGHRLVQVAGRMPA